MTDFKPRRRKDRRVGGPKKISEKDNKEEADKILALHVHYLCNMQTKGYGKSGHPDKLICAYGYFIGLEMKAGKNTWSKYQEARLEEIQDAGGLPLLINEHNLSALAMHLRILKRISQGAYDMTDMKDKYLKQAGPILAKIRDKREREATEVAKKMGMHRQTLGRYERGESPMPAAILLALCEEYDANISKVFAMIKYAVKTKNALPHSGLHGSGEEE